MKAPGAELIYALTRRLIVFLAIVSASAEFAYCREFNSFKSIGNPTIVVADKFDQTISFDLLPAKKYGDGPFFLNANSTSDLTVQFASSNTSVATISGKVVTIIGVGATTITASQPGNDEYNPAPEVPLDLVVSRGTNTIFLDAITPTRVGATPFAINATSSSGLEVSFSTTSDKITLNGKEVTPVKGGRVTIKASQAGNDTYVPATPVEKSFCVNPAKPTITVDNTNRLHPTLTSSNDGISQWFFNDALITDESGKTLVTFGSGTYSVATTVDDCTGERSDGTEIKIVVTGVEDDITGITMYPNPAIDALSIEVADIFDRRISFQITDLFGRTLFSKTGETNRSEKLNIENMSSGCYFMNVVTDDGVRRFRFVKK